MKQKLVIIGAGEAARPILIKAEELGIDTICFGNVDGSIVSHLANCFIPISIFDEDAIYEHCKTIKPDGVIASSEITTEIAANLASRLNLPGNAVEGGFAGRSKLNMRRFAEKAKGIKQPQYYIYAPDLLINFPVVVKANDSCGKRGVRLVTNQDEYIEAVNYARNNTSDGIILIEEYIKGGREFSVECISSKGIHQIVQITEKVSSGSPHFAELAHHQPANLKEEEKSKIVSAVPNILKALGINNSMAHVEIKLINDEIYFIELGARAGGDFIADKLVGLSTDFDYYRAAIETALGTYQPKEAHNTAYAGVYFLCKQTEKIYPLIKLAHEYSWCIEYELNEKEILREIEGNADDNKAGYLIYCSDHKITLNDILIDLNITKINDYPCAYELLYRHNIEIGRDMEEEELKAGIEKFIKYGDVLGIIKNDRIIAMLNLYCNNYDSLDAYICNVYVINEYRGLGISKQLVEKAIAICQERKFKKINLHVAKDNYKAINLYRQYGFDFTGSVKQIDGQNDYEMSKSLS